MLYSLISLETNPACANITCHHGGSCVFINETSSAVCSCYNNFDGNFCEGIIISTLEVQLLPKICNYYWWLVRATYVVDGLFLGDFFWKVVGTVCIHMSHVQLPYTVINVWRINIWVEGAFTCSYHTQ